MYEVRQLDASAEKPFKILIIYPGAIFITITYLFGFFSKIDPKISNWLHDFFSSLEDGHFLFYIARDLPYAGYDNTTFLAHNLIIAFLGPILAFSSLWAWRGFFLQPLNEGVNFLKVFSLNFLICLFSFFGAIISIYFNDHETGFCGGCEYNWILFPVFRYMSFFVLGVVACQFFNSFFFLRSKLNSLS